MRRLVLMFCLALAISTVGCNRPTTLPMTESTWSGSLQEWTEATVQTGENQCGKYLAIRTDTVGSRIRVHADGDGIHTPEFLDLNFEIYRIKLTNSGKASVTLHYTAEGVKTVEVFLPERDYTVEQLKNCGIQLQ